MSLHHRTWFPFVLVGLSLSLVLLIIFFITPRPLTHQVVSLTESQTINPEAYKIQVHTLLQTFLHDWPAQSSTDSKTNLADQTLSVLFTIRVPKDFLDTHLGIVLAVQDLRRSLPEDNFDAFTRLQTLVTSF